MLSSSTFADRKGLAPFVLGVIGVSIGVLLHLPMFLMGSNKGFELDGMLMGADMIIGMTIIVISFGVAAYGLLPNNVTNQVAASHTIRV